MLKLQIFVMQCCKAFQRIASFHKKFSARRLASIRCKIKTMNFHITGKELKNELAENLNLLLVHFKTEWNGACQILVPVYEDLANVYKREAKFFTIDAQKNKTAMHEYGVVEIPTILFFKDGKLIDHVTGLASKRIIISKIENALTSTNN